MTADRLFDGERMIADGAVAITGDRVVAVGAAARARSARRTRAFADATILPGLVDLHVHGIGCGQVASAVTTVRDLAAPLSVLPLEQRPRAPRVVAAGPFLAAPGGYPAPVHGIAITKVVRGTKEARAAVKLLARRGAGVIKVGLTPRFPNLSRAELRAIVDEAHAAGLRVSAHVDDSDGTRTALAVGVDDLAHMPAERDEELMRRVARAGIEIVGTLHVRRYARAAALANARAFVRAGGTLLYGSDFGNPGIPTGVDREELRLMGRAGLSTLDVLRNATVARRGVSSAHSKSGDCDLERPPISSSSTATCCETSLESQPFRGSCSYVARRWSTARASALRRSGRVERQRVRCQGQLSRRHLKAVANGR